MEGSPTTSSLARRPRPRTPRGPLALTDIPMEGAYFSPHAPARLQSKGSALLRTVGRTKKEVGLQKGSDITSLLSSWGGFPFGGAVNGCLWLGGHRRSPGRSGPSCPAGAWWLLFNVPVSPHLWEELLGALLQTSSPDWEGHASYSALVEGGFSLKCGQTLTSSLPNVSQEETPTVFTLFCRTWYSPASPQSPGVEAEQGTQAEPSSCRLRGHLGEEQVRQD